MASWLDNLQQASFRGVPFQVETAEHTVGDNVVVREYPFQDLPTVFRMGEASEEIKFSAYVIGDDYMEQRDALRAVLTGEGVLIHPTAGSVRVFVAGKYPIKENPSAEGGMARFDLTFIRAESRRYPVGVSNTTDTASAAAETAKAASKEEFASQFSISDATGWLQDRVINRILAVAEMIQDETGAVIDGYAELRDGINALARAPLLLGSAIADLLALPGDMEAAQARDWAALMANFSDIGARLGGTTKEGKLTTGDGVVLYSITSEDMLGVDLPSRKQLDAANGAVDQLIESCALAGWVQACCAMELDNYDEVLTLRAQGSDQAARLLRRASMRAAGATQPGASSGGGGWHDAMVALQAASVADLRARSRDMARLTSFTPDGWMPVWLVSYKLFGTAAYADEILALNPQIHNPLLVPPGKALRVMRHE